MSASLRLECEAVYPIDHHDQGLVEPSGLAMAADGSLWTVGDRKRYLFRIDAKGRIEQRLDVENRGLEGITVGPEQHLWVVDEDAAKVIVYDNSSGQELADYRLSDLAGFEQVAGAFERHANKGLEGIAFDPVRRELLLLKEDRPGMLLAVNQAMTHLVSVDLLNEEVGFRAGAGTVDLSGICYDVHRDLFWIVSHEAQCVFGYDRRIRHVTFRFELRDNDEKGVRQAEGIAVDPTGEKLYVVGDKDEKLFVYRLVVTT